MTRSIHKLSAVGVAKLTTPGRHGDGGGLYLDIAGDDVRKWIFRFRSPDARHRVVVNGKPVGKVREMGLGGVRDVTLALARQKAMAARALIAQGIDPIEDRRREGALAAPIAVPTFKAMADEVIASLEKGFRNDKHIAQWHSTMAHYAAPLHAIPVDQITTEHVLKVLQPIWTTKSETASRVRGRIEKILDAAKARRFRDGENPARWRGHLDHLLSKRQKLQRGHHPAMPWADVPAFIGRLRAMDSVAARCLEFVILTGARSGEVLKSKRDGQTVGARWDEFDLATKVWTVPASRMKAGDEHRVPLCDRALEILRDMEAQRCDGDDFVFPGGVANQPPSSMALEALMRRMGAKPATVHGFRSSFRDWAGECTGFPREVIEQALAHQVGSAVERAYRRGDALEKRRELMNAWAAFCEPEKASNVVPIKRLG